MTGLFFLSWTPVLLLTVLAIAFRQSALALSVWGGVWALMLAKGFFDTPLSVGMMSALDGVFTTLPLMLVILGGILFSSLLIEAGSLNRIMAWFRAGAGDGLRRNLLITFGVGNFMEGTGVIAEPVVAPMLRTAGVSATGAAALSIIGYAGLMSLEMAGIVITVLSLVTGLPLRDLGMAAAWISIPAVLVMALAAPLFFGKGAGGRRGFLPALGVGLLLGFSGLAIVWMGALPVSGALAGVTVMGVIVFSGPGRMGLPPGIIRDLAPFVFLIVCLFSVNSIPVLRSLTFERVVFQVQVISVHTITFRPLFSAYLYLFAAFFLTAVLHRISLRRMSTVIFASLTRSWPAFAAMALFGAMGQVISYTGYGPGFADLDTARNIPWVISQGLVQFTGGWFPVFVPLLGWVGTFLTGYGVASLMLFGKLQVEAASLLGTSAAWLAGALAVGCSLGSISSPFKVALATAMVGAVGKEGAVLRYTIPLGIIACLLVGVVVWMAA
ncbi:MAG: L-lactate permease [Desulfotignum sp.]|nr:L-lactate permease [Desulfotignum sp.]